MIVWASAALMSYELFAMFTHKPTITSLSHRQPYSYLIWGYLGWLTYHLVTEAVEIPAGTKL